MNYYEHHIGDYAEATFHLSFVEDAAYCRLIRKYYATERPLPGDMKQIQRLVGARTKEEKSAVETILGEFFYFDDGVWRNKRCDEEISKYLDGEPEREVKKANETNRLKRHREERAALFKRLTDAGHHAAWNIGMVELRELVKRHCDIPETELPPLPETAPETPATATQTPDTRHQSPELTSISEIALSESDTQGDGSRQSDASETNGSRKGNLCRRLRLLNVNAAPHFEAWEYLLENHSDDEIISVAEALHDRDPNRSRHLNYLVPILKDKASPSPTKTREPPWWASETSIKAKGAELGIHPRGSESWNEFKARIQAKLSEQQGASA